MMNCRHATQLMSQELDRELGWRERLALRLHLTMCGGCSNFRRQMALLRRVCRRRAEG
jgi:predicted anti-sigma-YlaC factor YlaD